MHLILCVDTHDGMLFGEKRLSSDRQLTEYILQYTAGRKLWLNAYSAKLFVPADVIVDDDFLNKAENGDYCFLENTPLLNATNVESVTLCHWNRHYPATKRFPRELLQGMHLVSTTDFPGKSHEKITIERYTP